METSQESSFVQWFWFSIVVAGIALLSFILPSMYGLSTEPAHAVSFGTTSTIATPFAQSKGVVRAMEVNGVYFVLFTSSTGVTTSIFTATSSDGATWSSPAEVDSLALSAEDMIQPNIDFKVSPLTGGYFAIMYTASTTDNDGLRFSLSTNTVNWIPTSIGDQFQASDGGECSTNSSANSFDIATSSNFLVAACVTSGGSGDVSRIIVGTSTDAVNWSTSTVLSFSSTTWDQGVTDLRVDVYGATGTEVVQMVHMVRDETTGVDVFYASSTDSGVSFTTSSVLGDLLHTGPFSQSSHFGVGVTDDNRFGLVFSRLDEVSFPNATATLRYAEQQSDYSWTVESVVTSSVSIGGELLFYGLDYFSTDAPAILGPAEFGDDGELSPLFGVNTSTFDVGEIEDVAVPAQTDASVVFNSTRSEFLIVYPAGGELRAVTSSLAEEETVPDPPASVTFANTGTSTLDVLWDASAGATQYSTTLYFGTSTPVYVVTSSIVTGTTTWSVSGITPGGAYYATVEATNGAGTSAAATSSNSTSTAPVQPPAPTVTASTTSSTVLNVGLNYGDNSPIVGIALHNVTDEVWIAPLWWAVLFDEFTSTSPFYYPTSTYGSGLPFTWGGPEAFVLQLTPNTEYTFVTKLRNAEFSPTSTAASAYTTAVEPASITASSTGSTTSTITFTPGALNPTTTEHALYESNTDTWINSSTLALGATTSQWAVTSTWFGSGDPLTVTGLDADTEYCFAVLARNGDGIETATTTATCITTAEAAEEDEDDEEEGGSPSGNGGAHYVAPPKIYSGSVQINDGDASTDNRAVTVSMPETNAALVALSEDPDFEGASFVDFEDEFPFELSEGNGNKRIYVRFKKSSGGAFAERSDSILLTDQPFDQPEEPEEDEPTEPAACPVSTQEPYTTPDSSSVYLISADCTKRPFISADVYATYFPVDRSGSVPPNASLPTIPTPDWGEVQTTDSLDGVPDDSLGFMPWGPYYNPQFGALVKQPNDSKVYLLLNGEKNWITDPEVFEALNYQWSWIEDVHEDLLPHYTTGSEIDYTDHHPDYSVIKYANDSAVYQLQDQTKRWIPSPEVFNSLNFRWDRIITVPDTETYPDGEDL